MTAETWAALGTWAAVLIAGGAAFLALRQLKEAQAVREEQAKPYVMAFTDHSLAGTEFLEFVVRNFGTTAAFDIRIQSSPELRRANGNEDGELVELPTVIPMLAPGQEWRTYYDSGISREGSALPDRCDIYLTYSDSKGNKESSSAVVDWETLKSKQYLEILNIHHFAKDFQKFSNMAKKWSDSDGGLAAIVYDGAKRAEERRTRDLRRRELWAARAAERQAQLDSSAESGNEE